MTTYKKKFRPIGLVVNFLQASCKSTNIDSYYNDKHIQRTIFNLNILYSIPMLSEEYEISLVVECHHPPPLKLRVVREHGSQRTPYRVTQPRVEVVEHEFGPV